MSDLRRRQTIYSSSSSSSTPQLNDKESPNELDKSDTPTAENRPGRRHRVALLYRRFERPLFLLACAIVSVGATALFVLLRPDSTQFTQDDIDAAVLYTLESIPAAPSAASVASVASGVIRPSVVRIDHRRTGVNELGDVEGADESERKDGEGESGSVELESTEPTNTGTGVVIDDSGLILTNFHVVFGAERLVVIFFDGFESDASIVSVQPEQDLAVVRVQIVPEGLVAATVTSTAGLRIGDEVVAVGNPFGIGRSVSAGVISGLGRTYVDEEGNRVLNNMIQFDAAVNPGNSGGPLVNRLGEVIGIVTAIYNPTDERVFIGIGFAVPIETAAGAVGRSPF